MEHTSNYRITSFEAHTWLLHSSLLKLTEHPLVEGASDGKTVWERLKFAEFAVVSHGTESDPIFNYANPTALKLFEMDFESFTQLPSRKSAEAPTGRKGNDCSIRLQKRATSKTTAAFVSLLRDSAFELKMQPFGIYVMMITMPLGRQLSSKNGAI